ncbi:MAG: hybrid sensor histidine kinase/response regulator [Candidatus Omnitrophica bacterium]|nr:hybrid sensor histidine kinase/response regulator [Candidatus Omnitrophota bacterium]
MINRLMLNLLLVEDNPDHALLAQKSITSSKENAYSVELVGSVEEAIERMKGGNVSMVISDYNLPGKSGLELLEWMNGERLDIPFIMLTGRGDEKTAVKAMQEGAYNYIVKDDLYLSLLPHVIGETFLKFLAVKEKERYEREIREKNAALEKANRELKKLDQLKSDFIASVSHDVRTPLNAVQESISLILDGIVDTHKEKGKQVLEIAKRSLRRLTAMINDLLDFSKLEAGKMRLHFELCDVQVLVDEVFGALRSLAGKKQIKLVFQPIEPFPKVECDAERIVQVLANLVGNAIKFTPEGGSITVQLEQTPNGRVLVSVIDTGIGIKKEDLERVFERFEQVKGAGTKENRGTGLGLSICKELVKLHGGDIWAESEYGKGSRFLVSIPITHSNQREANSFTSERATT